MIEVELEEVSKVYPGGVRALAEVSVKVEAGQRLVLLGRSGSGKTTVLRLVAGLEQPTAGQVRLGGRPASMVPPHRRGIALVAQRPVLYPHLRVGANLRFGLETGAVTDATVAEVAALLGIEDLLDRLPGQLSGGQQQRVALGKALCRRPGVLLLDEPFAGLDGVLRWQLREELHLLCRRLAVTMIHVTHDQEEALSLADRLAVLDQGRFLQIGPPLEVLDRPASVTVARLLGWPPINLVSGTLRLVDGGIQLQSDAGMLPVPPSCVAWGRFVDRPVLVGIRPTQVRPWDGSAEGALRLDILQAEPAGESWHLLLGRDRLALTACWSGQPPAGRVEVVLDLSRAHLFDAVSGLALAHGRGRASGP